jgi:hypothetical protein
LLVIVFSKHLGISLFPLSSSDSGQLTIGPVDGAFPGNFQTSSTVMGSPGTGCSWVLSPSYPFPRVAKILSFFPPQLILIFRVVAELRRRR